MSADEVRKAIGRVRIFFMPSTSFSSGIRIYEPSPSDPFAAKKNEIIGFVSKITDVIESGKHQTPAGAAALRRKIDAYRDSVNDVDKHDYAQLLAAVQSLVDASAKEAA